MTWGSSSNFQDYLCTLILGTIIVCWILHFLVLVTFQRIISGFRNKQYAVQKHASNLFSKGLNALFFIPATLWMSVMINKDRDIYDVQYRDLTRGIICSYLAAEVYDISQRRHDDFLIHIHHACEIVLGLLIMEWSLKDYGVLHMALLGSLHRPMSLAFPLLHELKEPHNIRALVFFAFFWWLAGFVVCLAFLLQYLSIYWNTVPLMWQCIYPIGYTSFFINDIPFLFFMKAAYDASYAAPIGDADVMERHPTLKIKDLSYAAKISSQMYFDYTPDGVLDENTITEDEIVGRMLSLRTLSIGRPQQTTEG